MSVQVRLIHKTLGHDAVGDIAVIRAIVKLEMFISVFSGSKTLEEEPAIDSITLEAPLFVVEPAKSDKIFRLQSTRHALQDFPIALQCCIEILYTDLMTCIETFLLVDIDVTGQKFKVVVQTVVGVEYLAASLTILDNSRVPFLVKSLCKILQRRTKSIQMVLWVECFLQELRATLYESVDMIKPLCYGIILKGEVAF